MLQFASKIRILPLTIFSAFLLLSVKVGDIWQGVDGLVSGVSVAEAEAQQDPRFSDTPVEEPQQLAQAAEEAPAEQPAAAQEMSAPEETASNDKAGLDDPTLFTQAEIDLLQQLADRREELEARDQELNMREGLLQAAETRINRKLAEMQEFKQTIEGLIKSYDEQQAKKMQSLVKIYENMKPKDAARIFEELDMDTLLLVAESMKERKLAAVMSKMNPGKAKDVTEELARLRDLPQPGS